jgi:hypothetical protein
MRRAISTLRDDHATQIVEFALSLPVLVVLVVGIFDFSQAINLKQKLTNAAREGARVAAADPANDLAAPNGVPLSVSDAFYVVDSYLVSEKIDCDLIASYPPTNSTALKWVATATGPPCGAVGLQLTIDRGCITPQNTLDVVDTCVTIAYPYSWKFAGVAGLFGGRFAASTTINTTAVAFNEN